MLTEQPMKKLTLTVLESQLSVSRFTSEAVIPDWALQPTEFMSITRTKEELSIVSDSSRVPSDAQSEGEWRALKVEGPLDFQLIGVLSSLLNPLAQAQISVFTVSTYDTDYILLKEDKLEHAIRVLENDCHCSVQNQPEKKRTLRF